MTGLKLRAVEGIRQIAEIVGEKRMDQGEVGPECRFEE